MSAQPPPSSRPPVHSIQVCAILSQAGCCHQHGRLRPRRPTAPHQLLPELWERKACPEGQQAWPSPQQSIGGGVWEGDKALPTPTYLAWGPSRCLTSGGPWNPTVFSRKLASLLMPNQAGPLGHLLQTASLTPPEAQRLTCPSRSPRSFACLFLSELNLNVQLGYSLIFPIQILHFQVCVAGTIK